MTDYQLIYAVSQPGQGRSVQVRYWPSTKLYQTLYQTKDTKVRGSAWVGTASQQFNCEYEAVQSADRLYDSFGKQF